MASPDSESDIFYINTRQKEDGNYSAYIGERNWELEIDEIEFTELRTFGFPKKYFKKISVPKDGESTIYMFDSFLMVSSENSDLLISQEISV